MLQQLSANYELIYLIKFISRISPEDLQLVL
jgi:hypothetical protein